MCPTVLVMSPAPSYRKRSGAPTITMSGCTVDVQSPPRRTCIA